MRRQELVVILVVRQHMLEAAGIGARRERHLPDARSAIALRVEDLGEGLLGIRQLVGVGGHAVHVRIPAGVQAGARWHALRRVHEGVAEAHAFAGQPVRMRRPDQGVAVATEAIGPMLVVGDDQQVPLALWRRQSRGRGRPAADPRNCRLVWASEIEPRRELNFAHGA